MKKRIVFTVSCIALATVGYMNLNESNKNSQDSIFELNSITLANAETPTADCYEHAGSYCKTPQRIWFNARNANQ